MKKRILVTLISLLIISIISVVIIRSVNKKEDSMIINIGNGITIDLTLIKKGAFNMGSLEGQGEEDEGPRHEVTISKNFYMGTYEITQAQFEEVMGYNPSKFVGENNPVDSVSYKESLEFIEKLNEITGKKFSLPTEAQWEYACNCDINTSWFYGSKENESELESYAWIYSNSEGKPHEVGTKKANPWGLYDMYGNVQEWCNDWYENPYALNTKKDPMGPESGSSRVIRGGAWGDYINTVRTTYRNASGEENKNNGTGFRISLN